MMIVKGYNETAGFVKTNVIILNKFNNLTKAAFKSDEAL